MCSEEPNKLIYLKFSLPMYECFLKSSTGGVWNSNGVAQLAYFMVPLPASPQKRPFFIKCQLLTKFCNVKLKGFQGNINFVCGSVLFLFLFLFGNWSGDFVR